MAKKEYIKPKEIDTDADVTGYFWELIIYPRFDEDHKKIFDVFSQNLVSSCVWIEHDKDLYHEEFNEDGSLKHYDREPKKIHTHIVWKTESKVKRDVVSALSHVPTHLIKRVNTLSVKAQYLLHRDVQSLFDEYQHKYQDFELQGGLPLIPTKWDEDYLFDHWGLFVINTSMSWGDVVYYICKQGHFRWLNKYKALLKDIYYDSHYGGNSLYKENTYQKKKELEKCTKELECLPLQVKTEENGLI